MLDPCHIVTIATAYTPQAPQLQLESVRCQPSGDWYFESVIVVALRVEPVSSILHRQPMSGSTVFGRPTPPRIIFSSVVLLVCSEQSAATRYIRTTVVNSKSGVPCKLALLRPLVYPRVDTLLSLLDSALGCINTAYSYGHFYRLGLFSLRMYLVCFCNTTARTRRWTRPCRYPL